MINRKEKRLLEKLDSELKKLETEDIFKLLINSVSGNFTLHGASYNELLEDYLKIQNKDIIKMSKEVSNKLCEEIEKFILSYEIDYSLLLREFLGEKYFHERVRLLLVVNGENLKKIKFYTEKESYDFYQLSKYLFLRNLRINLKLEKEDIKPKFLGKKENYATIKKILSENNYSVINNI